MPSPLDKVREIEFPKVSDPRGNLSFIEEGRHVPFPIRRVFYIYDIPSGETRGGHAHRRQSQVVCVLAGSFDLRLSDGREEKVFRMNRPNRAVLVPPGVWLVMNEFSSGAVCLTLCSDEYEEEDYIRDLEEYRKLMG